MFGRLGARMDFNQGKQGVTNSEVREYVLAATPQKSSSLGTVLSVLAILVPAAGVYAWRSGMLDGLRSPVAQSAAIASTAATGAGSSVPKTQTSSAPFTSGGPRNGAGDPFAMALTMQMNMDVLFEFVGDQMEMSASMMSKEPKRWIPADQLVAHCKQIARMQIADRGRAYSQDGAAMYNLMGERIHCLLTKRPEKLCDADTKAEVVRQYTIYHKVKHGALDVLLKGDTQRVNSSKMNAGVHGAIKQELNKLGARGYLQSSDFGWVFPPADIKEVFADIKNVQPVCKS